MFGSASTDSRIRRPFNEFLRDGARVDRGGEGIGCCLKLLDLWKDADPCIAEVEGAKKRLAGLKASDFLSFWPKFSFTFRSTHIPPDTFFHYDYLLLNTDNILKHLLIYVRVFILTNCFNVG